MITLFWFTTQAQAAAFDQYAHEETFSLPPGGGAFDVLPDGRLVTVAGTNVLLETAVGSRSFGSVGSLGGADFSAFGPTFVRLSPDGRSLAVGNGGGASFGNYQVGVFDLSSLAGAWFPVSHFDAEWVDTRSLALTAGTFGSPARVTVLDTQSSPAAPVNPTVLDGIGGASGGITFDDQGTLFTSNGFATSGPSGTGAIRAFDKTAWAAALTGGPAADFESGGSLIADVLSGASLGFDAEGNLFAGGGDFSAGEFGFAALMRASAVQDALAGLGPVDPAGMRLLDPDAGNAFNFYDVNFSAATGHLYVRDAGVVHAYVVPEPATFAVLAVLTILVPRRGTRRFT